jgi:hypothetical protein
VRPDRPDDTSSPSKRFAETFAKRPAVPRITRLPGARAWATTAVTAAVVAAIALSAPLLGRIGGGGDQTTLAADTQISSNTPGGVRSSGQPGGENLPSANPTLTPSGQPIGKPGTTFVQRPGVTVTQPPATTTMPGKPGTNVTTTTTTGTGGTTKSGTDQPDKPGLPGKPGADSTTQAPPKPPRTTTTSNPPQIQNAPKVTSVPVQNYSTNRCVDVKDAQSGTAKDGSALQLWDCANSTNQKWAFFSDGTVRSLGLCMDLAWAKTDDGTPIQLVKCNGGWAQRFTLNGSHDLVNPQADKCVTADGTGNGARLVLRSCNGTSSQKWRKA